MAGNALRRAGDRLGRRTRYGSGYSRASIHDLVRDDRHSRRSAFPRSGPVETIPYSQFEALLDKVAEVSVVADSIQGTLRQPLPSGKRESFAVRADPQLAEKLAARYGDRP